MGRKLTTDEVAAYFRTAPSTVRYWRLVRTGPVGVKVGRRVLYDERDVEAFERKLREEQGVVPNDDRGTAA